MSDSEGKLGRFFLRDADLDSCLWLGSLCIDQIGRNFTHGELLRYWEDPWETEWEHGEFITEVDGTFYGLMADEIVPLTPLEQLALEAGDT